MQINENIIVPIVSNIQYALNTFVFNGDELIDIINKHIQKSLGNQQSDNIIEPEINIEPNNNLNFSLDNDSKNQDPITSVIDNLLNIPLEQNINKPEKCVLNLLMLPMNIPIKAIVEDKEPILFVKNLRQNENDIVFILDNSELSIEKSQNEMYDFGFYNINDDTNFNVQVKIQENNNEQYLQL